MTQDLNASRDLARAVGDATKLLAPIYVILRETGEYSDRNVWVIRYVMTEDEAKAAVDRATEEGQSRSHEMPPYPPHENSCAWFLPDGSCWAEEFWLRAGRPAEAKWLMKPDADAITARCVAAVAAYDAACLAMGCVDPSGPSNSATYFYEVVTPLNLVASPNEGDESRDDDK